MAFLEVLTRTYKRPSMLALNQASMNEQSCDDWVQTLLIDEIGMGIPASHVRLAEFAEKLIGQYIWILDDDDRCIHPGLVMELKSIVAATNADVIFLRMDHGPRGVLPGNDVWGNADFKEGQIGSSGYVVRRELWQQCADAWRSARYAGDYDFIRAVLDTNPRIAWHNRIASRVQRISLGAPE